MPTLENKKIYVPKKIDRSILPKSPLRDLDWRHREIDNLDAREITFTNCDFSYSIITNSYFFKAKFENCKFIGTKFIDCNLKSVIMITCNLLYVHFERCKIELKEIRANLPVTPNQRAETIKNLKANQISMGDFDDLSSLALEEMEVTKTHLKNIFESKISYYIQKYPSNLTKIKAFIEFHKLSAIGWFWGHGEKTENLAFSCLVLLIVYWVVSVLNGIYSFGAISLGDAVGRFDYILRLFLDMSVDAKYSGFVFLDYVIVLTRYIYLGLLISVLYKRISSR